jgi:hypothetical protein
MTLLTLTGAGGRGLLKGVTVSLQAWAKPDRNDKFVIKAAAADTSHSRFGKFMFPPSVHVARLQRWRVRLSSRAIAAMRSNAPPLARVSPWARYALARVAPRMGK